MLTVKCLGSFKYYYKGVPTAFKGGEDYSVDDEMGTFLLSQAPHYFQLVAQAGKPQPRFALDLESFTVVQLKTIGEMKGVNLGSVKTKPEIMAALAGVANPESIPVESGVTLDKPGDVVISDSNLAGEGHVGEGDNDDPDAHNDLLDGNPADDNQGDDNA